ncbi:MAG: polysaccharide deacetylase family protein [Oscillospiraceae bacterium]|nr:polysaccharide deacetylase family protein [Oscillospiraceae bacterium]
MFITLKLRRMALFAGLAAVLLTLPLLPRTVVQTEAAAEESVGPRVVCLTFDDGPSRYTSEILDALARNGAKATFFVTGQCEDCFPCIARAYAEGHCIALHTYSHEFSQIYASSEAFWLDINRLQTVIIEQTGAPATVLRFAGGSSNSVARRYGGRELMKTLCAECDGRGLTYCDWNVDTKDAVSGVKSADYIARRAIEGALGNAPSVILMHDGGLAANTADALDILIPALREKGCVFAFPDELTVPVHHHLS